MQRVIVMDKAYIEWHSIMDRYMRGELSESETEEFEIYCMEHEDVADTLAYMRCLQRRVPEALSDISHDSIRPSFLARAIKVPVYALAASAIALVVAAGGLVVWRESWIAPMTSPVKGGAIVAHAVLGSARGGDAPATRVHVANDGLVLVEAELGPSEFEHFRLAITDSKQREVWSANTAAIEGMDGVVTVAVPSTALSPGRYKIVVKAAAEPSGVLTSVAEYELDVE